MRATPKFVSPRLKGRGRARGAPVLHAARGDPHIPGILRLAILQDQQHINAVCEHLRALEIGSPRYVAQYANTGGKRPTRPEAQPHTNLQTGV